MSKVVMVTGAGRGIGRAIVQRLAADGATIAAIDIDRDNLERTASSLGPGTTIELIDADVSNEDSVADAFERTLKSLGSLNALVTAAGVHPISDSVLDTSLADWRQILDINLTGTFLCCKAAIEPMVQAGSGRIVAISSINGTEGNAFSAAYNASKHGVIGLTRSLACELGEHRITVNAVCPGPVDTDLLRNNWQKRAHDMGLTTDDFYNRAVSNAPLGRLATAEDISGVVSFLLSDDASYITREEIVVSGGLRLVR